MSGRLRWDGGWAYSGQIVVGMVGERKDGTVWYSATEAVHMRYISKGRGEVKSIATAKRAVERAWATWVEVAGLEARRDDDRRKVKSPPQLSPGGL